MGPGLRLRPGSGLEFGVGFRLGIGGGQVEQLELRLVEQLGLELGIV